MSVSQFFEDVVEGNESHAWSRVKDWWTTSVSPELKEFLSKAESAEGKILQTLVTTGLKDVVAGGFTTAAFVTAGKDILAQLISQNITTFTIQNVIAMLNIQAAPLVPVVAAPVDPAPVVAG